MRGGAPSIWVTFPWYGLRPRQLLGALDRADVSIGTAVFFIQGGALDELYRGAGGGPRGGGPSGVLWKKGVRWKFRWKGLVGPVFFLNALRSCRFFVTAMAVSLSWK